MRSGRKPFAVNAERLNPECLAVKGLTNREVIHDGSLPFLRDSATGRSMNESPLIKATCRPATKPLRLLGVRLVALLGNRAHRESHLAHSHTRRKTIIGLV